MRLLPVSPARHPSDTLGPIQSCRFLPLVRGSAAMKPRRVAFLGFEGVNALDLIGPSDVFASALVEESDARVPGYAISILGVSGREFRSESGIVFKPHCPMN